MSVNFRRTYYEKLLKSFDTSNENQCRPSDCENCVLMQKSYAVHGISRSLCQWIKHITQTLGADTESQKIRIENHVAILKEYGNTNNFCENTSCYGCPLRVNTSGSSISVCSLLVEIRNRLRR
jgi:hypothetical protein